MKKAFFTLVCLVIILASKAQDPLNINFPKGRQPAILFVHGLGGSEKKWDAIKAELEKRPDFRFITNYYVFEKINRTYIKQNTYNEYVKQLNEWKKIFRFWEEKDNYWIIREDVASFNISQNSQIPFFTLTFNDNQNLTFREQGERVLGVIERIKKDFGAEKIILVGHSMGGLACKAAIMMDPSSLGGYISIASPHLGSFQSYIQDYIYTHPYNPVANSLFQISETLGYLDKAPDYKADAVGYLKPGSNQIEELRKTEFPENTPLACIISRWDPQDLENPSLKDIVQAFLQSCMSGFANIYGTNNQTINNHYNDGVVPVMSQDLNFAFKNGYKLQYNNYISDRYHTEVPNDMSVMLPAIADVLSQYRNRVSSADTVNRVFLGYILDSSGSMQESDPMNIRKSALISIIDLIDESENIFVVDFDSDAEWINPGNYNHFNKPELKEQVNRRIDSEGGTDIGAGIKAMQAALEDKIPAIPKAAVLLLSDGKSDYHEEALWFTNQRIPVYTVSYKQLANGALLEQIATSTNGTYLQADNEEDIVEAFMQFYNELHGFNKYLSKKGKLEGSEKQSFEFLIDKGAALFTGHLGFKHMTPFIRLLSPVGKVYDSGSDQSSFKSGSNYLNINLTNPPEGFWKVEIENPSPQMGEYIFEASGKSPFDMKFVREAADTLIPSFRLLTKKGLIDMATIVPEILMIPPNGARVNISSNYKDGKLKFYPYQGEGNYTLNVNLKGKDLSGNSFQRFFSISEFVGEGSKAFTGKVNIAQGSFAQVPIGRLAGNYEGMNCIIMRESPDGLIQVGKGRVTWVDDHDCQVEVYEYMNGAWESRPGDFIQLDPEMWKRD